MPSPPCGNYGDVNGDGNVDGIDGFMLAMYLAGNGTLTADQLKRANVKGYGDVSEEDADLINQYAVGNISTFPVCGSAEHVVSVNIPIGATLKIDGVERL